MSTQTPSLSRVPVATLPPIPEPLLALAPLHLANHRQLRYIGDNLCISLAQLAGRDQTLLRDLYGIFTELQYAIANTSTDDASKWQEVVFWTQRHSVDRLIDEVRELGMASHAENPGEELAKAMHDVRGGALSALLGRLQLLDRLPRNELQLRTLFVLTRDHLKIMRSAILGLDDLRRDADRRPKGHHVRLMLEKWHDSIVGPKWQERPIRMSVDCRYDGTLTECCLESAAIDRIFYNLANNAARHCAGQRVDMVIFPVPPTPQAGACLRFVLSNEVDAADIAFLATRAAVAGADSADRGSGLSLHALFEPEVSSTGSGFGLTVVAEFVAGAFGLANRQAALRERYLGAVLEGNMFRVWFHWPVAHEGLPPKVDNYHEPAKALSEP